MIYLEDNANDNPVCVLQTVFPIETSKKTTGLLGFVIFSMVLPTFSLSLGNRYALIVL